MPQVLPKAGIASDGPHWVPAQTRRKNDFPGRALGCFIPFAVDQFWAWGPPSADLS